MAFKLTKAENALRDGFVAELEIASAAVVTAIEAANEAIEAYNEKLGEVREFRDDLVSRMNEEFENHSEKWQEGETAEYARTFTDKWERFDFDDVDAIDDVELPHRDTLEDAPTERD